MKKTFEHYGYTYTVEDCKAEPECGGGLQEALHVYYDGDEPREVTEFYVFGWIMPEDTTEFYEMCRDETAWEPVYNYS